MRGVAAGPGPPQRPALGSPAAWLSAIGGRTSSRPRLGASALAAVACVVVATTGVETATGSSTAPRLNHAPVGIVDVRASLPYQAEVAFGTGIVLTANGEVLTNNHVIRGATVVRVTDIDSGRVYSADVVGYSVSADLALLRLQGAARLRVCALGDSASLKLGDSVTAYGNAGGSGGRPSAASGRIVAEGRSITESFEDGGTQPLRDLLVTDAALRPGDSGGPLIEAGRAVGVDTAGGVAFRLGLAENMGVAIPIDRAYRIAESIAHGHASDQIHIGPTAFLGIGFEAWAAFRGPVSGLTVVRVAPGSPAARAGLVPGDVLHQFDGHTVAVPNDLLSLMSRVRPRTVVTLGWSDLTGLPHSADVICVAGPPQ